MSTTSGRSGGSVGYLGVRARAEHSHQVIGVVAASSSRGARVVSNAWIRYLELAGRRFLGNINKSPFRRALPFRRRYRNAHLIEDSANRNSAKVPSSGPSRRSLSPSGWGHCAAWLSVGYGGPDAAKDADVHHRP